MIIQQETKMTETQIEANDKYQHNGKGTAILKKRGIIC